MFLHRGRKQRTESYQIICNMKEGADMKKALNGYQFKIVFVILLLLQVFYMVYWGNVKSGFYVDEFFTYDNAHYMSASTPKRVKMYDADYMEYDKWFDLSELKATLTVDKSNSLFNDGLVYNVKALMKKPYMTLLNYVEAAFFEGELDKWSGISMNIVFFAIGQLFLYRLAKKLTNNEAASCIAMSMFGFSGIAVSMVAFVRFYMLVNMWMIIFLYLHALMWTEESFKKNILYEILAMVVLYPAFKNSPLAMIEGASVIALFSVALLVRKRKKQFLFYALPIFAGGFLYIVLFTGYMQIIFHLKDVASGTTGVGVAAVSLVKNLVNLTPENFVSRSVRLINFINDYLFAHVFVFAICAISVLFAIIRKRIYRERLDEGRSFAYCILVGTIVLYFIASVCLGLPEIRYNSFLYPIISIAVVAIATDAASHKRSGRLITIILAIAVCAEIYFTVTIPRVQNSYPEDRAAVESIQQHKGIDHLVVDYKADDRVLYECVAYGDDTTKIMFTRFENCSLESAPDTMLVWQSVNWSAQIVDQLKEAGYTTIEQIAQTHESMVFLCQK